MQIVIFHTFFEAFMSIPYFFSNSWTLLKVLTIDTRALMMYGPVFIPPCRCSLRRDSWRTTTALLDGC